jgi:hypothetical protein
LPLCSGRCRRAWLRGASLALFGAPPGPRTTTTLLASPLLPAHPLRSRPPLRISVCGAVEWREVTTHARAHTRNTPFRLCWRGGKNRHRFPPPSLCPLCPNPNPQTTAPSLPLPSPFTVTVSYDSLPPRLSSLCVKSHLVMVSCNVSLSLVHCDVRQSQSLFWFRHNMLNGFRLRSHAHGPGNDQRAFTGSIGGIDAFKYVTQCRLDAIRSDHSPSHLLHEAG